MKNVSQIKDSEIGLYSNDMYLRVYEKLDMIYFKIRIMEGGYAVTNSKGKPINEIDIIVNSVCRDIMTFVKDFDKKSAYEKFGEVSIGFFYLPVHLTRKISYDAIDERTFILSDIYTADRTPYDWKDIVPLVGEGHSFISGWNGGIGPFMGTVHLGEWFDRNMDPHDFVHHVCDEIGNPVSGNDADGIEGLVLRGKNCQYEVIVNDTVPDIEASSKLIYRDTLLESVIHTIPEERMDAILDSGKDYKDKIYDLFLEYVDTADFFNTMWFEEEDFLPPIEGYIGDISYDLIPPIVAMICRKNPVYKNVLRIFLVTFSASPNVNKFKRFKEDDRTILTRILAKCQMDK